MHPFEISRCFIPNYFQMKNSTMGKYCLKPLLAILLPLLFALSVPAQEFEDRMQGYLRERAQDFFLRMAPKQRFLHSMIQQINREIRLRQREGAGIGKIRLNIILGCPDSLVDDYMTEMNKVVEIISELERLEQDAKNKRDQAVWERVLDLRENLIKMLEDREIYKKRKMTRSVCLQLVNEYDREVERLLDILDELDKLKKTAIAKGNTAVRGKILQLQKKIGNTLEKPMEKPLEELYYQEFSRVAEVLRELDALKGEVKNRTVHQRILALKKRILDSISPEALAIVGYHDPDAKRSLEDFLQQWKAAQIIRYKAELTQARIIKSRLLAVGNEKQKQRMFRAALSDALMSYSRKDYQVACLQFEEILRDYDFYKDLSDIRFYLSESYFAQKLYDRAEAGYKRVLKDYPQSEYASLALFKLMLISYTYSNFDALFAYYEKLTDKPAENRVLLRASYLAGYCYFLAQRYRKAISTLSRIPPGSKYFLPSQYLIGVCYAVCDEYDKAISVFENLASKGNYPWTDVTTNLIKNNALLKLGFIYYEKGDFQRALEYFDRVSKGHQAYDKSLVGKAWAEYKAGRLADSITDLRRLSSNFLTSNYIYEAKVLSAQCKRRLGRTEEALRDLKYVAETKEALRLAQIYQRERSKILRQLHQLDSLEVEAIQNKDEKRYRAIQVVRRKLRRSLRDVNRKYAKLALPEEVNKEKEKILQHLQDLDTYQQIAEEIGRKDVMEKIEKLRKRLMKSLQTYQHDRLANFPQVIKESHIKYRREILDNLKKETTSEKQRISENIATLEKLIQEAQHDGDHQMLTELEMKREQLVELRDKINKYEVWLMEQKVEEMDTDYQRWADLTGYGISDIDYLQLKEKEEKIAALSKGTVVIDQELQKRRKEMAARVKRLREKIKQVEQLARRKRLKAERQKQEKYLEEYFIKKQREVGTDSQ